MEQRIPDIRRYRPDVPDSIASALMHALDREPETRFESARQLGTAILDGLGAIGMRPWSQGDVGDFVKANFAEELGKRSHQVAAAVHKTASGMHSQPATMPLIAQPENHPDEN